MFLTEHLYTTLNSIKETILDNKGIIWGAYVQNSFLNKHYSDIYYDLNLSYENYWNHEYHPETIDRITIEDSMSVHFYSKNDYDKLLNFLKENKINYMKYDSSFDITIEYFFDILIIISDNMPPYKNGLFISHSLIMYKNFYTNKIHIEFSNNSGTDYDYISESSRENVKKNVITDIYKKKTMITSINIEQIFNYINLGWTIINMPYTILKKGSKVPKFDSHCCLVCLEELFDKNSEAIENIAVVYSNYIETPLINYYPIHNNCLMNWIKHNLSDYYDKTSFTCPYRFTIDFENYKFLLNYDYYILNKITLLNKIRVIEL